jgi:DNA-binding CsgD family transcriptional regulator
VAQCAGVIGAGKEVAVLIGSGLRVRQAAVRLDLAEHTVRNHLKRIFAKLQIGSQMELVSMVHGSLGGPASVSSTSSHERPSIPA